jgi:ectoine hydroxylase-related dioxygenase (phytanoyl-CoA dioxygenase family)
MNTSTPDTALADLVPQLRLDGYTVMQDAIPPDRLPAIQAAYHRVRGEHPRVGDAARTEVARILEHDSALADLMDWPTTLPVAHALIGADITLASGGELDHRYGHTRAHIGWHNDWYYMRDLPYPRQNFWIRCTYFIEDVTADMGPFTVMPGTHLAGRRCPAEWNESGLHGPREIPGAVRIVGQAGSCLINNSEIWHTAMDNTTDRDRCLIMILYKHSWMKQEDRYEVSPDFAAAQTDPIRRQLVDRLPWRAAVIEREADGRLVYTGKPR